MDLASLPAHLGELGGVGDRVRPVIHVTLTARRERHSCLVPGLVAPLALRPDVRPMASSPALDVMFVKNPPEDGFFDANVFYIGGVNPYYNWTLEPWTTWSQD